MGSGLPQNINANSREVAAKRFVDNKWVDYEAYFLLFLSQFLRALLPCRSEIRCSSG